jgi:hypothetical protein
MQGAGHVGESGSSSRLAALRSSRLWIAWSMLRISICTVSSSMPSSVVSATSRPISRITGKRSGDGHDRGAAIIGGRFPGDEAARLQLPRDRREGRLDTETIHELALGHGSEPIEHQQHDLLPGGEPDAGETDGDIGPLTRCQRSNQQIDTTSPFMTFSSPNPDYS